MVTATALGIYLLKINGNRVGSDYFTPGFTSYKHTLQYNLYDITDLLEERNEIVAIVGGGWAAGRFTYSSKSHITCDRQAFLAEIFLQYTDGTAEKIVTDESWQLSRGGEYRFADFYDGEIYDGAAKDRKTVWRKAGIYKIGFSPRLTICNCPVRAHENMMVKESFQAANGKEHIYDFGQNFAGVVKLKIKGRKGQKIVVRHAEILTSGDLNVKSLRTAKATAVYICRDGEQEYSPTMTYMGFRYIGISGISPDDIEVSAVALYSDMEETGGFECSESLLNKLQSNIACSVLVPRASSMNCCDVSHWVCDPGIELSFVVGIIETKLSKSEIVVTPSGGACGEIYLHTRTVLWFSDCVGASGTIRLLSPLK